MSIVWAGVALSPAPKRPAVAARSAFLLGRPLSRPLDYPRREARQLRYFQGRNFGPRTGSTLRRNTTSPPVSLTATWKFFRTEEFRPARSVQVGAWRTKVFAQVRGAILRPTPTQSPAIIGEVPRLLRPAKSEMRRRSMRIASLSRHFDHEGGSPSRKDVAGPNGVKMLEDHR